MVVGIVEDTVLFATNQISYIITFIATGILAVRYIVTENKKHAERVERKVLGPDKDGKAGKGGLLDELREEYKEDLQLLAKDLRGEMSDSQKDLLFEYKKTVQKINFMLVNFSRMEKSLEKVTNGRYTAARMEASKEMKDEDDFLSSFDLDQQNKSESDFDTFNKRKKRRNN